MVSMVWEWLKLWWLLGLLLPFLGGCESAGPQDFDDVVLIVDKVRVIAQEQGVSWAVTADFTGDFYVYETFKMGLDSGIRVRAHFQGNAQGGHAGSP